MRRQGFTLVEMMVSLALVLFIMVILSQAFQAGLESFRLLKGIGDLEDNLRSVATILRRDLAADHFEGKRQISDESFWTVGPPREGFFRIWHGSPYALPGSPSYATAANVMEATAISDPDHIGSSRATDHMLHFSVKLRGNQPQDFVSATLPLDSPLFVVPSTFANPAPDARYQTGSDYSSQWFEVIYCLRQTGTTVLPDSPSGGPGTPVFALIRRQLVVVPDNTHLNWRPPSSNNNREVRVYSADPLPAYAVMSCKKIISTLAPLPSLYPPTGDNLYFNNPTDLTVPPRRFGMIPLLSRNQLAGQHERAGLPSVPLVDPNGAPAGLNPLRTYPMLGEMIYQNKKYTHQPPAQWPGWLQSWMNPNLPAAFFAHVSLPGQPQPQAVPLPVVWNDNPALQGADVLLTDVVSFEVKVLLPERTEFTDLFDPHVPANNTVFRGNAPRVFDTWSNVKDDTYDYSRWSGPPSPVSAPAPITIRAIQITLRVWDRRTQQTRQTTLVQPM
jgi:prepilin-type N-terminal cleavage/methylation domain-containing protein